MASTPEGWVTLIVPDGMRGETWTYEPTHGTVSYTAYREDAYDPNSRWLLDVPADQAWYFMKTGGYQMAQRTTLIQAASFTPIYHPDGHQTCSWGGAGFVADDKGVIYVPTEGVAALQDHGWQPAPPEMLEPEPEPEPEESIGEDAPRTPRPRRRSPASAT